MALILLQRFERESSCHVATREHPNSPPSNTCSRLGGQLGEYTPSPPRPAPGRARLGRSSVATTELGPRKAPVLPACWPNVRCLTSPGVLAGDPARWIGPRASRLAL